ncbi:hypothetical protein VP01_1340g1 [Puccinia sorghi]|uniref:Uncharacterized protein n=1 Tax=Puccinia sorghi TaxID=27349 RepID=A0A0L6VMB8_9BASI|nr:hypothetical protein VP01_1340g1 [Puccinia sorghi]
MEDMRKGSSVWLKLKVGSRRQGRMSRGLVGHVRSGRLIKPVSLSSLYLTAKVLERFDITSAQVLRARFIVPLYPVLSFLFPPPCFYLFSLFVVGSPEFLIDLISGSPRLSYIISPIFPVLFVSSALFPFYPLMLSLLSSHSETAAYLDVSRPKLATLILAQSNTWNITTPPFQMTGLGQESTLYVELFMKRWNAHKIVRQNEYKSRNPLLQSTQSASAFLTATYKGGAGLDLAEYLSIVAIDVWEVWRFAIIEVWERNEPTSWVSPTGGLSSASAPLYNPQLAIYHLDHNTSLISCGWIVPFQLRFSSTTLSFLQATKSLCGWVKSILTFVIKKDQLVGEFMRPFFCVSMNCDAITTSHPNCIHYTCPNQCATFFFELYGELWGLEMPPLTQSIMFQTTDAPTSIHYHIAIPKYHTLVDFSWLEPTNNIK